jgi:Protein of unknown function (DUF2690)
MRSPSVTLRTILAAALTVAIGASPARAVGCRRNGCNGKNPAAMGCGGDAVTITQKNFNDAGAGTGISQRVEVRHSKACNAVWSRVRASAFGNARVSYSRAYLSGYKTSTSRYRYSAGIVYSNMRRATLSPLACGTSRWIVFGNPQVKTNCTGPS